MKLTPEQRENFNRPMTKEEVRDYDNFFRGLEAKMCIKTPEEFFDEEDEEYLDWQSHVRAYSVPSI